MFMKVENIPMLVNINKEFIERIKERRNINGVAPDDFVQDIKHWSFENIMAIAMNKEFGAIRKNSHDTEIIQIIKQINRVAELSYELDRKAPIWKLISTPESREIMSTFEAIQMFVEKYIDEAQEGSIAHKLIPSNRKLAIVVVIDMLLTGLDPVNIFYYLLIDL